LAQNIYHEAGHETREGQIAVALVTLNRLASGNYANDVCGVVNQKTNGICQFSWVCQPFFTAKFNNSLYNDIRNLAVYVLMNYDNMGDVTKGATYYHADYVNPGWNLPKTTQIGRHIFYKRHTDIQTMKKEIKI
jgi:spore germination cell wall hydrolase CwlJ-like protein